MSRDGGENRTRIRVLVVIKGLGLGGAERLLADSSYCVDQAKFEYEFCYFLPHKNHFRDALVRRGFRVHCVEAKGRFGFLKAFWGLKRILDRGRFDVIHAHLPVPGVFVRLLAGPRGIPVIYTQHNLVERGRWLSRHLNLLTLGLCRRVVGVTTAVTRSLLSHRGDLQGVITTITNGVPREVPRNRKEARRALRARYGIPEEAIVVGCISVFSHQKRLDRFIATAAALLEQDSRFYFFLAGHGPLLETLRGLVPRSPRFVFHPFPIEAREHLAMLDAYLMTSDWEGLPMAALEAMAQQVPVFSTPVGGLPELQREGLGWAVSFDAVEIAQEIRRQFDCRENLVAQALKSSSVVRQKFSIEGNVRAYEALYLEVLRPLAKASP